MVAEMLSQEEINALLGNMNADTTSDNSALQEDYSMQSSGTVTLSPEETDALGEIGNICMGTAATTLFTLLNHKVLITTPKVEALTWEQFINTITDDLTAVSVDYTEGFRGSNLMILKDHDVKIIADLMMGGTGAYAEGPVTDLHLSAIAESMNQMIGSSSTSMAQIFNKKIDISPPQALKMEANLEDIFGPKGDIVKISFRLQIEENIIDSELMQVLPIQFAKELIAGLLNQEQIATEEVAAPQPIENKSEVSSSVVQTATQPTMVQPESKLPPIMEQPYMTNDPNYYGETYHKSVNNIRADVDVQTPQFQSFDNRPKVYPKENMDLLMDVSLEVSVELGRTSRKIKEILEFGPGSIIELNRLVGEPVDVLVNGKFVATGEVVVIDENFGIRITDIINPEDRI
ncbi:flagellar motor switch phosphatase FliY [Cellulosilyticum lentocellum]|uniref:CheC, inhibitor of MCP methylation / FliN fusion protein n=1 Tax=Cellulosilyticum lentocellum (strain ATCC 49066 / DSM 5427 / NCIMB 11756 / RHM5) TaxID=642492 RepID=F2JGR0_CELLD|nr:flagellar motor switch phosphatase FliY [Cellulosilyticum lentocellum]ADZ84152.1 CheC, inhibitor of MCP methylation / FliN fusion protein [Cellulosilyticum lentocellum DSM 5427]